MVGRKVLVLELELELGKLSCIKFMTLRIGNVQHIPRL